MIQQHMHKRYKVIRGQQVAQRLATGEEVDDFLDACGMLKESQEWEAAKAGNPFVVDRTEMRFVVETDEAGQFASCQHRRNDIKLPFSKLNTKMAVAWGVCSVGGAILAVWGEHPIAVEAGRFLLAMCAGYMVFGLGIKRPETSKES